MPTAGDTYLNLFALSYISDIIGSLGQVRVHTWMARRQHAWEEIHRQMWPGCEDFLSVVQRGLPGARRKELGPPELAQHVEAPSVTTALAFAILVWAVTSAHRPYEQCVAAAAVLASMVNDFIRGNTMLTHGFDIVGLQPLAHYRAESRVSLKVSAAAMCETQDLFFEFRHIEAAGLLERWVRLRAREDCKWWLVNMPGACSLGELLALCLLGPPRDRKCRQLGIAIAAQVAGHVDRNIEGKFEAITLGNEVRLQTPSGFFRRADSGHRQLVAATAVQQGYGASSSSAEQEQRAKRRAEKEARP